MELGLFQLFKNIGQLGGLIDIAGLDKKLAYIGAGFIQKSLQVAVEAEHADYVVHAALVYGDAGIIRLREIFIELVGVILDIYALYINAGGHNLADGDVAEVQRRLHKLALVFVKNILFLGGLDHTLELFHCRIGVIIVLLALERQSDEADHTNHHENKGGQDNAQEADGSGNDGGKAVCILLGNYLGHSLAEDDNNHSADGGGDPGEVFCLEHRDGDEGGNTGEGYVCKVVAYQYCGKGVVIAVYYLYCQRRAALAVLGKVFKAHTVGGGKAHLAGGEERGEHYAKHTYDNINCHINPRLLPRSRERGELCAA